MKNSHKVNHAIEKACAISLLRQEGNEEAAYRNFYDALCETSPFGDMIREQKFTFEEMMEINHNLREAGYGLTTYFYMPVFAFYRKKSFQYILQHREALRRLQGQEAFSDAALGLNECFSKLIFGKLFYPF